MSRAALESLLRDRKLDHTLTTDPAHSCPELDDTRRAPTGIVAFDDRLGGGLPRGELSEIAGPRSSGRTSVLQTLMAAATARGELVALVDPCDALDVASASSAGVRLDRLLWIRGGMGSGSQIDRALKAFAMVLEAGRGAEWGGGVPASDELGGVQGSPPIKSGFGLVALDLADVPMTHVRALPFTTWMRLERMMAGSPTVSLLVADVPTARSPRGVTIDLTPPKTASPGLWTEGLFKGLDTHARVLQSRRMRWRDEEAVQVSFVSQ